MKFFLMLSKCLNKAEPGSREDKTLEGQVAVSTEIHYLENTYVGMSNQMEPFWKITLLSLSRSI
jgi:hypothetical protein